MRRLLFGVLIGAIGALSALFWWLDGHSGEFPLPGGRLDDGTERIHRELSIRDLVELYPEHVTYRGPVTSRTVALTFDDGPDDVYTPAILDILAAEGVPATFFITGVQAEQHPTVVRRIVAEGHEAAHHGYRHLRFSSLLPRAIVDDLARNLTLLELAGSESGKLFRPPYGALDPLAVETLIEEGYRIVLWSIDPQDWREITADQIVDEVLEQLHPGAIVLLHSASMDLSGTVEAVPRLIQAIRDEGYEFVTVSQMFASLPPGMQPALPPSKEPGLLDANALEEEVGEPAPGGGRSREDAMFVPIDAPIGNVSTEL